MSGIHMLLMAGTFGVSLTDISIEHLVLNPANASAGFSLISDGSVTYNVDNTGTKPDKWHNPLVTNIGAQYWCRLNVSTGSVSSGTTGSILALNSSPSWTRQQTSLGTSSFTGTLEIFSDAGGTQLTKTVNVTMTASKEI